MKNKTVTLTEDEKERALNQAALGQGLALIRAAVGLSALQWARLMESDHAFAKEVDRVRKSGARESADDVVDMARSGLYEPHHIQVLQKAVAWRLGTLSDEFRPSTDVNVTVKSPSNLLVALQGRVDRTPLEASDDVNALPEPDDDIGEM